MGKLGYTWYPKDWGNSEAVFELDLQQRGLYRELIDLAMLNDNKIICNYSVWARKWCIDEDDMFIILDKLSSLNLINYTINECPKTNDFIFIPSCESRLKLSRAGKKGGEKSKKNKPSVKPSVKPLVSLLEKNDKPTFNQIESKVKEKEKESVSVEKKAFTPEEFLKWFNSARKRLLEKPSNVNFLSQESRNYLEILTNRYSGKDFGKALHNICNDKWANESNNIMPKHFLNPEQFTKYLDMEYKPTITKKQKLTRGWAV